MHGICEKQRHLRLWRHFGSCKQYAPPRADHSTNVAHRRFSSNVINLWKVVDSKFKFVFFSFSLKVYGSTDKEARELREVHGNSGHLRRGLLTETGGPLLPFATPNTPVDCKRDREESEIGCFLVGDVRANEQVPKLIHL